MNLDEYNTYEIKVWGNDVYESTPALYRYPNIEEAIAGACQRHGRLTIEQIVRVEARRVKRIRKRIRDLVPGDVVLSETLGSQFRVTHHPEPCRKRGYYRVSTESALNPVNGHGDNEIETLAWEGPREWPLSNRP